MRKAGANELVSMHHSSSSMKRQQHHEMQISSGSPNKRRRLDDSIFLEYPSTITPEKMEMYPSFSGGGMASAVIMSSPANVLSSACAVVATPAAPVANMHFSDQPKPEKEPVLEWWKQKQKSSATPSLLLASTCSVCRGSLQLQSYCSSRQQHEASRQPSPKSVMPENALLAYLAVPVSVPLAAKSSSSRTTSPPPLEDHDTSCSFCERAVCQNCLALCEDCQAPFCTFCRTTDYHTTFSREVCLDCHERVLQTCCSSDDAMNLD